MVAIIIVSGSASAAVEPVWVAYDDLVGGEDYAFANALTAAGDRLLSTGSGQAAAGDQDVLTVLRDPANGQELWSQVYGGAGEDAGAAAGVDASRGYVAGRSAGDGTGNDAATLAYNLADGQQLWAARYDAAGQADEAEDLALSEDLVFVAVSSQNAAASYDLATIAYAKATGAQVWLARYNGPGNADDIAASIEVSPDGARVFVVGRSWGDGTEHDAVTIAYDAASGAQLWVARFDSPSHQWDGAEAVGVSPDGTRVFVTGPSWFDGAAYDFMTHSYDAASGAAIWSARQNPGVGDFPWVLALSPDGLLVYVAGERFGAGARDFQTYAFDASNGAVVWSASYDNGNMDAIYGLAATPTTVVVTGPSLQDGVSDAVTVAYHATNGALQWLHRFQGPGGGSDASYAVVRNAAGTRAYVAGYASVLVTPVLPGTDAVALAYAL